MVKRMKLNRILSAQRKLKFKTGYDENTGHFLANARLFTAKQAAEQAAEAGLVLDISGLEDVRKGYAAFRFNGLAPSKYTEVEQGTRGAFPVWIIPAFWPL